MGDMGESMSRTDPQAAPDVGLERLRASAQAWASADPDPVTRQELLGLAARADADDGRRRGGL
jgi:hypothetical protein